MLFRHIGSVFRSRVGVARRSLRSVPASGGRNRFPKIKGSVITLDNDLGNEIGPGEDFPELNRNLRKMFCDPEDIQSPEEMAFEEGDFSSVYEKRDYAFHAQHMSDKERRRLVKHQIAKKGLRELRETNLLTYAAKKQIRYLYELDPVEWTPEKLSECFPISPYGVKRLVKNNSVINSEEKIRQHDNQVAERWEALQNDDGDLTKISPVTIKLWREGKLVQDFYSGNVHLPEPPQKPILVRAAPKKFGEHASIVRRYLALKEEREATKLLKSSESRLQGEVVKSNVLPWERGPNPSRSDLEDIACLSFLEKEPSDPSSDPEVTIDRYEENLREDFSSKSNRSDMDETYLSWMKEERERKESVNGGTVAPYDTKESFHVPIRKSNAESTALATNVGPIDDAESMERSNVRDFIRIPSKLRKKGALYRVGKSFYDDAGQLLYRVPFLSNE